MKKELDYFTIEGEFGWNQDDFKDFWMRKGGCACVTLCDFCIYMKKHRGEKLLYPYDVNHLTKRDFIEFSGGVKPYLRPRWMGVNKLSMYVEGVRDYFGMLGFEGLHVESLEGFEESKKARETVKERIDAGFPIPYLLLLHQNPRFKDYVWHWFILGGYEERDRGLFVKAITYGSYQWLSLEELWDTGNKKKGGMILFSRE